MKATAIIFTILIVYGNCSVFYDVTKDYYNEELMFLGLATPVDHDNNDPIADTNVVPNDFLNAVVTLNQITGDLYEVLHDQNVYGQVKRLQAQVLSSKKEFNHFNIFNQNSALEFAIWQWNKLSMSISSFANVAGRTASNVNRIVLIASKQKAEVAKARLAQAGANVLINTLDSNKKFLADSEAHMKAFSDNLNTISSQFQNYGKSIRNQKVEKIEHLKQKQEKARQKCEYAGPLKEKCQKLAEYTLKSFIEKLKKYIKQANELNIHCQEWQNTVKDLSTLSTQYHDYFVKNVNKMNQLKLNKNDKIDASAVNEQLTTSLSKLVNTSQKLESLVNVSK